MFIGEVPLLQIFINNPELSMKSLTLDVIQLVDKTVKSKPEERKTVKPQGGERGCEQAARQERFRTVEGWAVAQESI